jgi:hypothetical protein
VPRSRRVVAARWEKLKTNGNGRYRSQRGFVLCAIKIFNDGYAHGEGSSPLIVDDDANTARNKYYAATAMVVFFASDLLLVPPFAIDLKQGITPDTPCMSMRI